MWIALGVTAMVLASAGQADTTKVTVCHATSDINADGSQHFNELNISESAAFSNGNGGHFTENGTPQSGHEEDFVLNPDASIILAHPQVPFKFGLDCNSAVALAVTTSSVRAVRVGRNVTLRWRTASEVGTLGFNVYRQVRGHRVKLNHSLIAAVSLSGNSSTGRYSFRARLSSARLAAKSVFYLQEVATSGARTWYGPVRAVSAA